MSAQQDTQATHQETNLLVLRCLGNKAFPSRLCNIKARFSTGASREAPVDNECLGKSRQVGHDGKSWRHFGGKLGLGYVG